MKTNKAVCLMDGRQEPAATGEAYSSPTVDTVLFLSQWPYARFPSETVWQRLNVMAKLGSVQVLSYLARSPGVIDPPPGVQLTHLTNGGPLSRMNFPRRVRSFARQFRREGGSGLIWTTPDFLARRAARAAADETGWPVVMDVWDVPDLSAKNQLRDGHYLKALAHGLMQHSLAADLKMADLIVWTLHRASARKYFDPTGANVVYLPNGVNWKALRALPKPPVETNPTSPLKLFYMGYYGKSRGSDLLSELLDLLGNGLPVELHVVGSLADSSARKALASIPGHVKGKIRFHGHLPWRSAMEVLNGCDICLYPFPRLAELDFIYPLKVLEYAAMDKCIVASDLVGARELLDGYRNVIFCDPTSGTDWAEAVLTLSKRSRITKSKEEEHPLARYDWELLNDTLYGRVKVLLSGAEERRAQ